MTPLTPLLTSDRNIGTAFARAVADILCGRYDTLGGRSATQPSAFHCPFLMDMIPRLAAAADDFKSPTGAGLFFVRDCARVWTENRWWTPRPHTDYAAFLTELLDRIDFDDARYLALLADNYAPEDRDIYAVNRMRNLQQQGAYLPDIPIPPEARDFSLIVRRSFLDVYPLVTNEEIFLPNRRASRYDPVRLRSLSRGFMSHPALIIRDNDVFLSTLNMVLKQDKPDHRKL